MGDADVASEMYLRLVDSEYQMHYSFLLSMHGSLLSCVPYVLTCQHALHAYVLTCQRALRAGT